MTVVVGVGTMFKNEEVGSKHNEMERDHKTCWIAEYTEYFNTIRIYMHSVWLSNLLNSIEYTEYLNAIHIYTHTLYEFHT